jgi:sulfate transport system substrate-binding protein
MAKAISWKALLIAASLAILLSACLPGSPGEQNGGQTITLYGFSIMKESLEKDIIPTFKAKWKAERDQDVDFVTSYAGSETVTNQILQGVPAQVAILSIERDVDRLVEGKAVTHDWKSLPNGGIVNKTPFIILVRKGNPKGIKDFSDLAKPDVRIIHPDPVSSGGAQWSILAIYGSELKKSKAESGEFDQGRALTTLQAIWKNVIATPGSAREARTSFETGYGDALITYELDGLMMKQAGGAVDLVIPKATIFSEHPAVLIDRNVNAAQKPVVEAFLSYLWSDEAQKAFVKNHFRSVTNETFNSENKELAGIEQPFTVDMFGGWSRAYPDVIQNIFQAKVQSR